MRRPLLRSLPKRGQPRRLRPEELRSRRRSKLDWHCFAWLTALNDPHYQAVLGFKARIYRRDKLDTSNLIEVGLLTREEVGEVCKKFGRVQRETDQAVKLFKADQPDLIRTPTLLGTLVHGEIARRINRLKNPNFIAEETFETDEELPDGGMRSIRVDVLENVGDGTVCVYDVKTGRAGLGDTRIFDIASTVYRHFPRTKRIVVTEVRPTK